MLYDLYLLSCYFEPSQAMMYEEDLEEQYGLSAVRNALVHGWIELYCLPYSKADTRPLCKLSEAGIGKIELLQIKEPETSTDSGFERAVRGGCSLLS